MTTDQRNGGTDDTTDTAELAVDVARIEQLTRRLLAALGQRPQSDPGVQGPGPEQFLKAATAYAGQVSSNPANALKNLTTLWAQTMQQTVDAQTQLARDLTVSQPFSGADFWAENPYFNTLQRQYEINADAMNAALDTIAGLSDVERNRLDFFSHQIRAMFNPDNFLASNPAALKRALDTKGQSLIDGLENLVHDLEANNGELIVTLSDRDAFSVGENLATTPGAVVFRNHLYELIQYTPSTETVFETPLVLFPPWINKFYILDLKEKSSLIKWIVDQGHMLFLVSWVNPDASLHDVGMDSYVNDAYLSAIEQVKEITDQKQVNAAGYCIGGATLALTLALLRKRNDTSVQSGTFFATLTDFENQGEIGVYLGDDFVDGIEREVSKQGILHARFLSRSFSYMRADDLVYRPAIRSYLMGQAPPAFDLLYWNGDGTNLPARMTMEYLRFLCQDNQFAKGQYQLLGETLSISDIELPIFAVACETDHIVNWTASYDGMVQMASKDKTFILSESGHIAGIINPPSKRKYGYYSCPDLGVKNDNWKQMAEYSGGSWWPRWGDWLGARAGQQVAARVPGGPNHPVLAKAPGTYVKQSSTH